jgi:hypothetical protein
VFHGERHVVHVNPRLQRVRALDVLRSLQLLHPAVLSQLVPLLPLSGMAADPLQHVSPYLVKAVLRTTAASVLTPRGVAELAAVKETRKVPKIANMEKKEKPKIVDEDDTEALKLLELFLPKKMSDPIKYRIDIASMKLSEEDIGSKSKFSSIPHHLVRHSPPRRRFSVTRHTIFSRHNGIDELHRLELEEEMHRANGTATPRKRKTLLPPAPSSIETRTAKKRRSVGSGSALAKAVAASASSSSESKNNSKSAKGKNLKSDPGNGASSSSKAKFFTYGVLKPESVIWLAFARFGGLNERLCDELEELILLMLNPQSKKQDETDSSETGQVEANEKALWNVWYTILQNVSGLQDDTLKGFRDPFTEHEALPAEMCPVCKKNDVTTSFLVCDGLIGPLHVHHNAYEKGRNAKGDPPYFGRSEEKDLETICMKDAYDSRQSNHLGKDCSTVTHLGPKGCMSDAVCCKDLRSMLIYPERCWFCGICFQSMNCQISGCVSASTNSSVADSSLKKSAKRGGIEFDLSNCSMDLVTLLSLQARCLQILHSVVQDPLGMPLYPEPTPPEPEPAVTDDPAAKTSAVEVNNANSSVCCLRHVHRNLLELKYIASTPTATAEAAKNGTKKQPIAPIDFLRSFQEDMMEAFKKHLTDSDNILLFKLYDGIMNAIADVREDFVVGVAAEQREDVKQFVLESGMLMFDRRAYMPLKHFSIYFQRFVVSAHEPAGKPMTDPIPFWEFSRFNPPSGTDIAAIRHVIRTDPEISKLGICLLSDLDTRSKQYPRMAPPGFGSYVDGPFIMGCDIQMSALHVKTELLPTQSTVIMDSTTNTQIHSLS